MGPAGADRRIQAARSETKCGARMDKMMIHRGADRDPVFIQQEAREYRAVASLHEVLRLRKHVCPGMELLDLPKVSGFGMVREVHD